MRVWRTMSTMSTFQHRKSDDAAVVIQTILQMRRQERFAERIVDVPVPPILEEFVEVYHGSGPAQLWGTGAWITKLLSVVQCSWHGTGDCVQDQISIARAHEKTPSYNKHGNALTWNDKTQELSAEQLVCALVGGFPELPVAQW